ncbi:MAG: ChbG/HpnK family deacetylase [Deltaproteobacteria bacterium]|nr:ChbG/HpnK family deacetylase [Deltaproteobacteria bacterium]
MLIVNADDFGINRNATDNIMACYKKGKITSTSAMVFMVDSERAATLASETLMGVGLHLNFTDPFSCRVRVNKLREYHDQIITFLNKGKYHLLLYNPTLKKQFEYVYKAQYEEFIRLYNVQPTHIDGHHHMHLCTNMLLQNLVPRGMRVRTTFTFAKKEKNELNRLYRRMISYWLTKRYICTDFLYSIEPIIRNLHQRTRLLKEIVSIAEVSSVELMVHPQIKNEYDYLMSNEFSLIISGVKKISYASL